MNTQITLPKPTLFVLAPVPTVNAIQALLMYDFHLIVCDDIATVQLHASNPDTVSCITIDSSTSNLAGLIASLTTHFIAYRLPIIVLCHSTTEINHACTAGADDYVVAPFQQHDLASRILMNIHRAARVVSVNPLTHLPGNSMITRVITQRLNEPLSLLYVDIDNFKIYNDTYGFARGDSVLLYTAAMLTIMVQTLGGPTDFVGHIGGDDFVIITTPSKAEIMAQTIAKTFDQKIGTFYNEHDRTQKKVRAQNRQGTTLEYPLISVSIAIVTNEQRTLSSVAHIAYLAAELKNYAKTKPGGVIGSNYVKDRRRA